MPIPAPPTPSGKSSIPDVIAFVDDYLAERQEALAADATRVPFAQRLRAAWAAVVSLADFDPYVGIRQVADELVPERPGLARQLHRIAETKAME